MPPICASLCIEETVHVLIKIILTLLLLDNVGVEFFSGVFAEARAQPMGLVPQVFIQHCNLFVLIFSDFFAKFLTAVS